MNGNIAQEIDLALDGGSSMLTDPSTSGRKYRKLVNYTTSICNESLCVVWED